MNSRRKASVLEQKAAEAEIAKSARTASADLNLYPLARTRRGDKTALAKPSTSDVNSPFSTELVGKPNVSPAKSAKMPGRSSKAKAQSSNDQSLEPISNPVKMGQYIGNLGINAGGAVLHSEAYSGELFSEDTPIDEYEDIAARNSALKKFGRSKDPQVSSTADGVVTSLDSKVIE